MTDTQGADQDPSKLIDLFCRKSQAVKSKGGKREISIKAQEARGRRVAEELGLTVRHVWREVGSASRFSKRKKRDDQDKALEALARGHIGALWLFRLDRWDRSGAGAILKIIEPEDGIPRRLLFDNGDAENPGIGLDSTNPRDRKELINRAEQAREETEILSERVRNTKDAQRANGEWVSGVAPYGLRVVILETLAPKGHVLDDDDDDDDDEIIEERKLALDDAPAGDPADPTRTKAQVAFDLAYRLPVSGISTRAIAAAMNAGGIPSATGGLWAASTVRDMVHNPVYAGWQTTGRQDGKQRRMVYRDSKGRRVSVMEGAALLTDEQQKAAQACLRGELGVGVPLDGSKHDTRPAHLLTGLAGCPGCKGPMSFTGGGYKCWKPGAGKPCPAPSFAAKKSVEEYVLHRWRERLINAEPDDPLLAEVTVRWAGVVTPEASEDEAAAREALQAAERALSRVWEDRRRGHYDGPSESFFGPTLEEVSTTVTDAQRALREARGSTSVDISFLLDRQSSEEAWADADDQLRRELLQLAIDEIWITKAEGRGKPFIGEERVTIKWAAES